MPSSSRNWERAATSRPVFELAFTARHEHIDELGHVNNAVWVQWVQQVATAHWDAAARPAHRESYFWVVTRHEIDYLRPAFEGDRVTARSWIGGEAKGARCDRLVEFAASDGRTCVRARTSWAIVDKASGRPVRIPPEVIAPFLEPLGDGAHRPSGERL